MHDGRYGLIVIDTDSGLLLECKSEILPLMQEMRVEFQKAKFRKTPEKLGIFKSFSQPFGTMYVNESRHMCLVVLHCYPK